MFASRPMVHPVEAPPLRELGNNVPRVRMKDIQGMAGTLGGLALRLFQFLSALVSLCVMVTISDFSSVTAFCYLVAAVSLQSLWSLSLAITDIYALSVRRSLRNSGVIILFTVGDGITSTVTFSAACASAGISVLIENDLDKCSMNPCTSRHLCLSLNRFSFWKMAKEDDEQTRLHQCVRKYKVMVKQFDELVEMMNTRTKLPKRRKVSSSTAVPPASAIQPDSNEALAQTITRFLHELNPNPNPNPTHPNCSTDK